jgi:hypothetical protein
MNLIEKIKRWWAPGEYDDERPASEGEGYAASGSDYAQEVTGTMRLEESERTDRVRGSGGI